MSTPTPPGGVNHLASLAHRFVREAAGASRPPVRLWQHLEPRCDELAVGQRRAVLAAACRLLRPEPRSDAGIPVGTSVPAASMPPDAPRRETRPGR